MRRRYLFFFFQAEDAIRDLTVTGVQTCALPILGVGAPEQLGVQHAGQEQVVGELGHAGDLGRRVDLAERVADDSKRRTGPPDRRRFFDRRLLTGAHTRSPAPARPAPPACAPPPIPRPRRSSRIPCSGTGCPTAPA